MESAIVKSLENLLQAEYIGSYSSGHVGAKIWRFKAPDKPGLVVKIAEQGSDAGNEIADNLFGYEQIRCLGGAGIIPPGLKELTVPGYKALVMSDLGQPIRYSGRCLVAAKLLWLHYMEMIMVSRRKYPNVSGLEFISVILSLIARFEGEEKRVSLAVSQSDLSDNYGHPALMILDFTPDNLFMTPARLSFIDPWKQETYLGHPAVSIGQFITLCDIYNLPGHEEASKSLKESCLKHMPDMLSCSDRAVEKALLLGATLQLVLSAYVRRESEPAKSASFLAAAERLWAK